MNTELVNRLTEDVLMDPKNVAGVYESTKLILTVVEVRRLIENVVEDTKKHIAKKLVESRKGMFELLIEQGFIDISDSSEEVEELVLEALNKL